MEIDQQHEEEEHVVMEFPEEFQSVFQNDPSTWPEYQLIVGPLNKVNFQLSMLIGHRNVNTHHAVG
jgi:hypothetical protein